MKWPCSGVLKSGTLGVFWRLSPNFSNGTVLVHYSLIRSCAQVTGSEADFGGLWHLYHTTRRSADVLHLEYSMSVARPGVCVLESISWGSIKRWYNNIDRISNDYKRVITAQEWSWVLTRNWGPGSLAQLITRHITAEPSVSKGFSASSSYLLYSLLD